jgi:hypothetical protein
MRQSGAPARAAWRAARPTLAALALLLSPARERPPGGGAGILLARFNSPGTVVISRVVDRATAGISARLGAIRPRVPTCEGSCGAVADKIGVVSAYIGEGLGQVMGLFGEISQELSFRDVIRELFGQSQVVILKLNPLELLVLAEEVTI